MWVWKKQIRESKESEWRERLSPQSQGIVMTSLADRKRTQLEVYCEKEETALALYGAYGGSCSPLQEKDWVAATAPRQQRPLLIRDRLVVCASTDQIPELQSRYPGRIILVFPAECAFGTGNHATTATCLRLLCDEARQRTPGSWRVIDAGCGTGILGLAAVRLGAAGACCYDFDADAVRIARNNMRRNGAPRSLSVFRADVFEWLPEPEQRAHVLLANLFSGVLQRAFPRLLASLVPSESSILIVSGILREQAEDTLSAAQAAGFSLIRRVICGKWVTFQLTPRP